MWKLLLCGAALYAVGCSKTPSYTPRIDMSRVERMRAAMGSVSGTASGAGAVEEVLADPTGWGTLRGTFKMVGNPPAKQPINISGDDMSICAPGGAQVFTNYVEVGAGGGLKNVVLFVTTNLKDEEPWTHPSIAAAANEPVEFDQKACRFLSHVMAMRAGQPLRVLNSDPTGHNTNLLTKKNLPFNRTVPANGSVDVTLNTPETAPFSVKCSIHPWMSAFIMVCPNGYFAVTDDSGAFEIPNLPTGVDLEFRVWHEKTNFLSGIEINGQNVKKGKFKLTLEPDQTSEIDVNLDSAMFN